MKHHFSEMKKFKEPIESGKKEIDPLDLSGLMIHLADLSSPAKKWKIARKWSTRVCEEFSA